MLLSQSSSPISLNEKIDCSHSCCVFNRLKNANCFSFVRFSKKNAGGEGLVVLCSKESSNRPTLDVFFEPFEEVKKELLLVPTVPQDSLARHKFTDQSEAAINEQINVQYNVSYIYHAMYAYFDRDNVALKGIAKFFKHASEEERQHAEKFMEYQNKRRRKVKLQLILMPLSEFDHVERGDALHGKFHLIFWACSPLHLLICV